MVKDYYLILGVPIDAAPVAIRSAFRRLARQYHPDVNPGDKAAELAHVAYEEHRTIREVVLESGVLPSEEVDELLDPQSGKRR